jgi:methyl-accepting chemotaxis protein
MNTRGINFSFNVRFVVIVTTILLFWAMFRYQSLSTSLEEELRQESLAVLDRLTISLPEPIWNYNTDSIDEIIKAETKARFVNGIEVRSKDKEVLAQTYSNHDDNNGENALHYQTKKMTIHYEEAGNAVEVGKVMLYINNHTMQKKAL